MTTVYIERPHGTLFDSDGKVCLQFANWDTREHTVPDYIDGRRDPQYCDGPAAHQKLHEDYR